MAEQQRITGIGGVFLRARDPHALAAWYQKNLGVPVEAGQTYATLRNTGSKYDMTVWSAFAQDSDYLGDAAQRFMVNYRVADLDAMLGQLRAAGADVDDEVQDFDYGRFGWATDPEGNRFELWEPRGPGV